MLDPQVFGEALQILADPSVWYQVVIGVLIGITVGAIPGLSTSAGMALALPATLMLPTGAAFGLIIGVYKGSTFGGSISAITFATPGTAGAAMTSLDGYPLMRQGKGKKALQTALYSSVSADVITDVATMLVAPMIAVIALSFGPGERTALIILAFMLIGTLAHESPVKGMLAAALGMVLGIIGIDPVAQASRLTFGFYWLRDGIDIIPLMIGMFAISTMLLQLTEYTFNGNIKEKASDLAAKVSEGLKLHEFRKVIKSIGIGIGIGSVCGVLPGLGSTAASMIGYTIAKRLSPNGHEFGKGSLEGIAAAESSNNATVGPTLIPLLAFGVPGSTPAALIGGALMLKGLTPSPMLFETHASMVTALLLILLLANFVNLILSSIVFPIYARVGQLPQRILIPLVFLLATVGTYAYRSNPYDVLIMFLIGIIGFLMKIYEFPIPPLVLAFILTPLVESSLRRALVISRGNLVEAFGSPLSLVMLTAAVIVFVLSFRFSKKMKEVSGEVSKEPEQAEEK